MAEKNNPALGHRAGNQKSISTRENTSHPGNFNPSPINLLLDRLDGARKAGADQWSAKCPAHDDRSPSLSVRELSDGRVLFHCHAGCPAGEVVASLGLTLADLFPDQPEHHKRPIQQRERWDYRALLRGLLSEAHVLLIVANDLAQNKKLPPEDLERVRKATKRIAGVVVVAE